MRIERRTFLLGACGSLLAAAVGAQEKRDRASLALWATTQNLSIPGLGGLPEGVKLEDLPPEAAAALGALAGGRKDLQVRLWSPGAAPAGATANLEVPAGLNLGATLPLEILRPEARRAAQSEPLPEEFRITDDFELRQYWGCSETVLPGQPKVIKIGDLPAADREAWKRYSGRGFGALEKPDWTAAVWPNAKAGAGANAAQAKPGSLRGEHRLRTSYLGEAGFRVTDPVDFLAPVTFTSPKPGKADLKRSIRLEWKPIPSVLGYHLTALSPKGRKLLIMWSGAKNAEGFNAGLEFPQMAQVRAFVEQGLFLPPTATSCNIPAGIFDGCENVIVNMTAYGPGQAFDAPNAPAIRVQTRSVGMLTLGLGAGGDDADEERPEPEDQKDDEGDAQE
ncbi:MAG TPA: hypothetical protein VK689_16390 [Armatimonadota bacterium]|nr:hypothetical protein [Armatimonadota bacterium]